MKIKITLLSAAIFAAFLSLPASGIHAAASIERKQTSMIMRCTVKDGTGTPLNVRSTPNGKKIVARLKNGTRVFVENYSGDAKDQSWAEVRLSGKRNAKALGWVLADLIECED